MTPDLELSESACLAWQYAQIMLWDRAATYRSKRALYHRNFKGVTIYTRGSTESLHI